MKPFDPMPQYLDYKPYTIGITTKENLIDQKRKIIKLKPGTHVSIKLLAQIIETSEEFDNFDVKYRKCKLSHEMEGFQMVQNFTRSGTVKSS